MDDLENKGIASRDVGVQFVAFDGLPTISHLYNRAGEKVKNAVVITHLGSGGVSFAWGRAGLGMHFQNPYFLSLMVVMLSLFTANLWG